MKKNGVALVVLFMVSFLFSACGVFGGAAKKNWTEGEVVEFKNNCQTNAQKILGVQAAKEYCDCAMDKVAKVYENYRDAKKASFNELREAAKDCE